MRGRLTVTKVVFESASTSCIISCTPINSNKSCFWIKDKESGGTIIGRLTVTKVVFELTIIY